jgi:hypothetical protein
MYVFNPLESIRLINEEREFIIGSISDQKIFIRQFQIKWIYMRD